MFKCSNVQMFKCSNVQMFKCSNVKCQMSNIKCQILFRLNFCWSVTPHFFLLEPCVVLNLLSVPLSPSPCSAGLSVKRESSVGCKCPIVLLLQLWNLVVASSLAMHPTFLSTFLGTIFFEYSFGMSEKEFSYESSANPPAADCRISDGAIFGASLHRDQTD